MATSDDARELLGHYLHTWKLLAAEFYTDQTSPVRDQFPNQWDEFHAASIPDRASFRAYAQRVQKGVAGWILGEPLDAKEERFPWAGTTRRSVALFLLRHSLYHIGELNAVLFRGSNGATADPWMG